MKHLLYSFILMGFLLSCGTENKPTYKLTTTVSPTEGGTISPSTGVFSKDEVVTLTGNPTSSGWKFVRWEGDWNVETNPSSITMNKNYNIIGVFERRNYPLNITIEGEGTVEERIIQQKSTEYPFETIVELTPIPSEGWEFVEWGGDLSGSEVPKLVTVSDEKNVTVSFLSPVYLGENGVTIMCPNGNVGDIGIVNGVEYEVVDREMLIQMRDGGRNFSNVCTSLVTDMSRLFCGIDERTDECHPNYRTLNPNIGSWDVSNVTNMDEMFYYSERFNQDIGKWDVRNVNNMRRIFGGERVVFNQPIGDWDVSSVTDMSQMFNSPQFNQPIGNWDVSSVTSMSGMFSNSQFNQNIGNWDVSSVTNMMDMFNRSQFNQPIGDWDVSSVTIMRRVFLGSSFNQPIGDWDVSSVTDMSGMFWYSQFNQPIGDWDVSSVTDMGLMFYESQFDQPIGDWDVSSVTDMGLMFWYSQFNQPINRWCVTKITSEPFGFSTNSPLTSQNKPIWGTCPTP